MSRLFFTLFCCFIHGASAQWPCARTEGKCMKKADCIKLGLSPFRYVSGVRSCKNNDMCCRDPYDENPCLALGGNCMDENTCLRAGGNVMRLTATGKFVCPTQPNNILCCTKSAKTAQNKCGFASPPESEIGKSAGQIANRSKWPWMALLSGNSGGHWSCAGVLISPTAVLTAAHCVSNERTTPVSEAISVTLGAYNLNHSESSRQTILVKSIIHPDFNHNNLTADLAILKLTKPAKINQFVNVLCLSEKTFAPETKCYAAGWGETMDIQSDPERSSLLREIVAPLWSWSNCKTLLDGINNGIQFDQTMTCAGGVNGAPHLCSGDSGSPLMCQKDGRWYLQGINSWSSMNTCQNDSEGKPDVFASIPHFHEWILGNM